MEICLNKKIAHAKTLSYTISFLNIQIYFGGKKTVTSYKVRNPVKCAVSVVDVTSEPDQL